MEIFLFLFSFLDFLLSFLTKHLQNSMGCGCTLLCRLLDHV